MGIEPSRSAWKADVLPLNYARRLGANRRLARSGRLAWESRRDETGSTVWRLVAGTGFEPVKALPSDLQSDPFGRSGISPGCDLAVPGPNAPGAPLVAHSRRPARSARSRVILGSMYVSMERARRVADGRSPAARRSAIDRRGASGGSRTRNPLITNQVLYRLSYASKSHGVNRGIYAGGESSVKKKVERGVEEGLKRGGDPASRRAAPLPSGSFAFRWAALRKKSTPPVA